MTRVISPFLHGFVIALDGFKVVKWWVQDFEQRVMLQAMNSATNSGQTLMMAHKNSLARFEQTGCYFDVLPDYTGMAWTNQSYITF